MIAQWTAVGLAAMALLLGFLAGYEARHQKSLHDAHQMTVFYERMLMADIIQQHVYMDPAAIIYGAFKDSMVYVGQTTKDLDVRVAQHVKGTSGFDRIMSRDPDGWEWRVLEVVPVTYRFAAERAWIKHYRSSTLTLMNGNDGTDDGLEWEIE